MEDPKTFSALLNGVVKRDYEGDSSITPAFLKEALFSSAGSTATVDETEIASVCTVASELLARAAHEDYDPAQLEAYLRMKKDIRLSASQKEVFAKFWRAQRQRVRDSVRKKTSWECCLERVAWRIDVRVSKDGEDGQQAKRSEEAIGVGEPVAIVELHMKRPQFDQGGKVDVARFEMNKEQVKKLLKQVEGIESDIAAATGGNASSVSSSSSKTSTASTTESKEAQ